MPVELLAVARVVRLHQRYAFLLILFSLILAAGLALYGRSFEPLSGDLTRIGWRSENDFGWTRPEEHFDPLAAKLGNLDVPYDVVAIGDSFTGESPWHPGTTWPHFLAHDTGLKVAIFDSDDDMVGRLLASDRFRSDPPAVVIYEIVERNLVPNHRSRPADACPDAIAQPAVTLTPGPPTASPVPVTRPTARAWTDWPASYAAAYLTQNLRRRIMGRETTNSVELDLTRGGLFSSRADRELLVYGEDFNKLGWTEADWRGAACNLLRMQARVEANGKTLFVAMVAPDKLTAYGPFLAAPQFRRISRLDLLAQYPALNLVRFDRDFDPTDHVDLYLPNDTHWSTTGHRLAARLVERLLIAKGALPP
ncbi:MAG TPA: hypothetical protein VGV37_14160 [Aliidongia sp.]|uniref:hypothetical protein n=1 Tax=Aliidongia sp. TaxID=1914230 RepID=UPI002DDCFAFE|nr:hypothetical protein [Aliidongia sp.]HEV2675684.1 hypothetical protein [Aliidongia sp.]